MMEKLKTKGARGKCPHFYVIFVVMPQKPRLTRPLRTPYTDNRGITGDNWRVLRANLFF